MATLHLVLDENDKMLKVGNVKGIHSVTFHLDNFVFDDEEIVQYATAAAMMLLGAMQESRTVIHADKPSDTKTN